jgi:hypothetical protein
MRGFARPSRGASTVTLVSVRRARRSARIWMSPIASGTRRTAVSVPSAASCLTDSSSRAGVVCPRGRGDTTDRPRSCERPRHRYCVNSSQRSATVRASGSFARSVPVVSGLTDRHPLVAHVLEPAGSRRRAVEVGDELTEDPGLIRIGDASVPVLDDRLGQNPPPRKVPERCPLEFAPVDADRRLR